MTSPTRSQATETTPEPTTPMTRDRAGEILFAALGEARAAVLDLTGHEPTARVIFDLMQAGPTQQIGRLREELRETASFLAVEARGPEKTRAVQGIYAALRAARLPLVCPDCGGTLFVSMGRDRWGHDEVDVIECDDYRCGASWDHRTGVPQD